MLGMGLVAQMPAITYVLARMGLVTARWMLKVWRVAVIVILIVAAVLSPTNDVPNMLLFAARCLCFMRFRSLWRGFAGRSGQPLKRLFFICHWTFTIWPLNSDASWQVLSRSDVQMRNVR